MFIIGEYYDKMSLKIYLRRLIVEAWQQGEFGVPTPIKRKSQLSTFHSARTIFQDFIPEAAEIIKEIARDVMAPHSVRFQCVKFAYEQTYGKAFQSVEIKVSDGISPDMMSSEQLKMYMNGNIQELIVNLHQTGKLAEYLKSSQISLEAPKIESTEASKDKPK